MPRGQGLIFSKFFFKIWIQHVKLHISENFIRNKRCLVKKFSTRNSRHYFWRSLYRLFSVTQAGLLDFVLVESESGTSTETASVDCAVMCVCELRWPCIGGRYSSGNFKPGRPRALSTSIIL
jgi:hypothetical protein